jgi:hypothetical protein
MAHSNDPFQAGSISTFPADLGKRRPLEVPTAAIMTLLSEDVGWL